MVDNNELLKLRKLLSSIPWEKIQNIINEKIYCNTKKITYLTTVTLTFFNGSPNVWCLHTFDNDNKNNGSITNT